MGAKDADGDENEEEKRQATFFDPLCSIIPITALPGRQHSNGSSIPSLAIFRVSSLQTDSYLALSLFPLTFLCSSPPLFLPSTSFALCAPFTRPTIITSIPCAFPRSRSKPPDTYHPRESSHPLAIEAYVICAAWKIRYPGIYYESSKHIHVKKV
ncbi:hypothetical protein GALMADRAFT_404718 [Galerina marginata CBS 339.88]|uniref:Uncharacterized protein n=1 Tax=Galerina marginata (strain CBS 339.88) TaxID=685588 RepID=A0A067TEK8_GALM3|nr:hypothetical protein GALMADRAFT_404718 [Galerina marginata CBS 339.88]